MLCLGITLFIFESSYEITKLQANGSQWFVINNKQSMTCSLKYANSNVIINTGKQSQSAHRTNTLGAPTKQGEGDFLISNLSYILAVGKSF